MKARVGFSMILLVAGGVVAETKLVARKAAVQDELLQRQEPQTEIRNYKEIDEALRVVETEVEILRAALAELEAVVASLQAAEPPSSPAEAAAPAEAVAAIDPAEWSDCAWRVVGKVESHNPQSEWCTPGSFITRIDLGSGPAHKGASFPIMERVECCRIGVDETP